MHCVHVSNCFSPLLNIVPFKETSPHTNTRLAMFTRSKDQKYLTNYAITSTFRTSPDLLNSASTHNFALEVVALSAEL